MLMEVVNWKKCVTLCKEPSKKAAALADVPLGTKVEYIGKANNGFSKVEYQNEEGYILAEYLAEVE